MKKLLFVAIGFAGLTFLSCDKDQSAVNKLDGTWDATKMEASDSSGTFDIIALGGSATYTFNKCKLKEESWCTGSQTLTFFGSTDTESTVYRVTGDGATLEFKDHDTSNYVSTMVIDELSRKEFKGVLTEGSTTISIEAEKQ